MEDKTPNLRSQAKPGFGLRVTASSPTLNSVRARMAPAHCSGAGSDPLCTSYMSWVTVECGCGREWCGVCLEGAQSIRIQPFMPRATTGQACPAVPFNWLLSAWERGPGHWLSCPEHGPPPTPLPEASSHIPRPPHCTLSLLHTLGPCLRAQEPLPPCQ